jgi:twitching motility two-component system response regulator PilH
MSAVHNILIVDDSKTELMFLSEMLKKAGYAVNTAENAEDARRQIEQAKPDLILLDVVMPGQNGFQFTRSLMRDPRYAEMPIILCTSKNQETDRVWGLRQGAQDYITKPVDRAELLGKIKALG